jgi:hypothetical protein
VDKRTEFPALEARKSDLEHQHWEATKQVNDGVYTGKLDAAVENWLRRIREELDELNYVLKVIGSQGSKIDVQGHTLLIAMIAYAIIMLVIVALFIRYLGA